MSSVCPQSPASQQVYDYEKEINVFMYILGSENLFQDTGNFRHSRAEYWDLYPEYEFEAFGRRFHIVLRPDSDFIHPDLKVSCRNIKNL